MTGALGSIATAVMLCKGDLRVPIAFPLRSRRMTGSRERLFLRLWHVEGTAVRNVQTVVWSVVVVLVLSGGLWAAERAFEVTGMGGAGGMYTPSVSPYDPDLMLISCDMSGSYRSLDGGKHWELIHHRQLSGSLRCRPLFLKDAILWVSGGTLKISRDRGETWEAVVKGDAPWAGADIVRLAAVESASPVLFVGTREGLWRSPDGGETWELSVKGSSAGVVALGSEVFAAVESQGKVFWRSADAGQTWQGTTIARAKGNALTSLAGGQGRGRSVLFATVPEVGTIRSTDGGRAWEVVDPDKGQNDILMATNQTRVAYSANRKGIFKTADGGRTWKNCFRMSGGRANVERSWVQTEIHWGYSISPLGIGVSPADPELVMVSTQGDFYISRNGARSWHPVMNTPVGVKPGDPGFRYRSNGLEVTSCWHYYFDPADRDRRYIAYTDIGFARSVDRGRTWIWSAEGCPWSNTFYQIAFDPYVRGKMYAATSNRHDIPHWTHISSNTARHAGGVCVSEDGGITWKVLGTGQPKLPCTSIAIDPRSPKGKLTLYATYYEGGVYKSTDNGATWTRKSEGLGNPGNLHALSVQVHPKTGDLYCSITAHRHESEFPIPGGIWKSTDGGDSWSDITQSLALAWPANFAVHPGNPDVIYLTAATIPGGRIGGLYKTSDGGKTWARLLRDEDFAKIGGESYVHVLFVGLHPDHPEYVYIGTAGHGLWMSPDAGRTWKWFKNFPFRSPTNVTFDPQNTTIMYVTTFGGGVWKGNYLPE